VLASLRSSITYKETGICTGGSGTIHVKLFNMVMEEAGPDLLRTGILVSGSDLETFLQKNTELIETCRNISLDNQSIDFRSLANPQLFADRAFVRLSVKTVSHSNKGS
jgi:hypothetical protein